MVVDALLRFEVVCQRSEESLVLIAPFRWFRYHERVDYVASFLTDVVQKYRSFLGSSGDVRGNEQVVEPFHILLEAVRSCFPRMKLEFRKIRQADWCWGRYGRR